MSAFSTVTCGGVTATVVGGTLLIPATGLWTADVYLATAASLSGPATVTIGDPSTNPNSLSLVGTIYRSDQYGEQTRARIVAGNGGWRTTIPAQGYGSPNGVTLAHVLGDAATAAGEVAGPMPSGSVGQAYARFGSIDTVAADVLWDLFDQDLLQGWYVDPTGKTQFTPWPSGISITTPFIPTDQKPDHGRIWIATEDYASWMPGVTFTHPILTGTYTSAGVEYAWSPDGTFRFDVLTGTTGDRVLGPIEAVVAKQIAPTKLYGRYEYSISAPTLTAVDLTPTNAKLGLPSLQNVPLCSDSISSYKPQSGGTAHVMFVNGFRSRPVVVWTSVGATTPAALKGGTVIVVLPPQMPFSGQLLPPPNIPGTFSGFITITSAAVGQIVDGSNTVSLQQ